MSREEFREFNSIIVQHYAGMYRKLDEIDNFLRDLAKEGLKEGQKKQLKAQMLVLRNQLAMEQAGFRHGLALDYMAKSASVKRLNWAWYRTFNKAMDGN